MMYSQEKTRRYARKNSNGYATARRKIALSNLEAKLSELEEENKEAGEKSIDLTKDKNYIRIQKEIAILKSKI